MKVPLQLGCIDMKSGEELPGETGFHTLHPGTDSSPEMSRWLTCYAKNQVYLLP